MPLSFLSSRRFSYCRLALALLLLIPSLACAFQAHKPGLPRAQKHEGRHEIDQMEEMWRQAMLDGDATRIANALADDFLAILPNGVLQDKQQTLEALANGRMRFTQLDLDERKVRFYGSTAVVICKATLAGTGAANDFEGTYRYTRVYVRNAKGQWKVVSFEASRIRIPGERHGEHHSDAH